MRTRHSRRLALPATVVAVVSAVLLPAGSATAQEDRPRVKAPRSGADYSGRTSQRHRLTLHVAGRNIDLATFRFSCRGAVANTSLQVIRVRKRRTGYRFRIRSFGIVTYLDGRPDQNGAIAISGTFSRDGKRARGRLRVRLPRCDTGSIRWRVRR